MKFFLSVGKSGLSEEFNSSVSDVWEEPKRGKKNARGLKKKNTQRLQGQRRAHILVDGWAERHPRPHVLCGRLALGEGASSHQGQRPLQTNSGPPGKGMAPTSLAMPSGMPSFRSTQELSSALLMAFTVICPPPGGGGICSGVRTAASPGI